MSGPEQRGRLSAALADRYSIEREIGSGGMATVYLAEDLKHRRKVAVKVLRPELGAIIGAERFLKEIEVTANLQHPNILPLYDSGEADGLLYYVMPFIEGEALRDRITREKQLSVEVAVEITKSVAAALQFAHERHVVHRDIKPENILLQSRQALVADFGIALAVSQAGGPRLTETGLSLGTPHYMSPEQASGDRELDGRTDQYSLAATLYELLVGGPPFGAASAGATIAKILTEEPRLVSVERPTVPRHVAAAIHKALSKLPADRFPTVGDFAAALSNPDFAWGVPVDAAAVGTPWRRRAQVAMGLAAVMTGLLVWRLVRSPTAPPSPVTRFAFSMARPGDEPWITISPDGRRIITVEADDAGTTRVVARDLGSTDVTAIAGTEGADGPFFSPDGAWIAFLTGRGLRKIPAGGGAAVDITDGCDAPASWAASGQIVCVSNVTWGLARVSADGGTPERLTVPDTTAGEIGHWRPEVLPGGNAVIFTNFRSPAKNRIEAYDLRSGQRIVLVEDAAFARYSPSGHLLFAREDALFAVPFDAARLRVGGGPVPVLEDVAWAPSLALGGFAVSRNGTLVVIKASQWKPATQLVWVARDGAETPALPTIGDYMHPRISPDGQEVVVTVLADGRRDLSLLDLRRGALSQFRRNPGQALRATWMPDGRELLYTVESPSYNLYRMAIDGSVPERSILANTKDKYAGSVSPDGLLLAYEERWGNNRRAIITRLDGQGPAPAFGDSLIQTWEPTFSPDGRWIAYSGEVSGPTEVYLRAVNGVGGRRQVSAGGGETPRWTRGGREIVYRRGDGLMAAPVDPQSGEVGTPTLLFRGRYRARKAYYGFNDYDVTADGGRFLFVKPITSPGAAPIVVTLNWFEELKRKMAPR